MNFDRVLKQTIEENDKRMLKAVKLLIRETKKAVSRGQPRKKYGGRFVGLDPSKPFTPPKVLTGVLRNSISFKIDKGTHITRAYWGVVKGAADAYALGLELGTGKMLPRPYLRTTRARLTPEIKRILKAR